MCSFISYCRNENCDGLNCRIVCDSMIEVAFCICQYKSRKVSRQAVPKQYFIPKENEFNTYFDTSSNISASLRSCIKKEKDLHYIDCWITNEKESQKLSTIKINCLNNYKSNKETVWTDKASIYDVLNNDSAFFSNLNPYYTKNDLNFNNFLNETIDSNSINDSINLKNYTMLHCPDTNTEKSTITSITMYTPKVNKNEFFDLKNPLYFAIIVIFLIIIVFIFGYIIGKRIKKRISKIKNESSITCEKIKKKSINTYENIENSKEIISFIRDNNYESLNIKFQDLNDENIYHDLNIKKSDNGSDYEDVGIDENIH